MSSWISRRFGRYARGLLLAAIFLVPLAFHRATLDVFNLLKLSTLWVLGITAWGLWVAWSIQRRVWVPRFALGYAAAAFLAAYGLAAVFSQNRLVSLLGIYHRYGGIIPIFLYALTMLVVVGVFWENPSSLKAIPAVVALAWVPLSAYMVIQAAGLDPVPWRISGRLQERVALGTLGNPNFAGGYLAVTLPLVGYLLLHSARKLLPWVGLCFVLGLYALWLSRSRGAILGAVAGLVVMACLYRERLSPWIKKAALAAALLGALSVLVLIWRPGPEREKSFADRSFFRSESAILRQYYWATAWRIFLDYPLTGTGPDTFYSNFGRYRTPEDGLLMGTHLADKPHNIYLEYAANSGILGLGSYAGMAGLALFFAFRQSRDTQYRHRGLLIAFASAFVAYLVQGMVSIDVPTLAFMGWVYLGGIAVTADPRILHARDQSSMQSIAPAQADEGTGPEPPRDSSSGTAFPSRPLACAAAQAGIGILVVCLVSLGSRPLLADIKLKSAQNLVGEVSFDWRQKLALAIDRAEAGIRLNPIEAHYWSKSGQFHSRRAARTGKLAEKEHWYRQAWVRLLKAQSLQPTNIYIGMELARFQQRWGEQVHPDHFREADLWWIRTVAMDPTNWALKFKHAEFLGDWGAETRRINILRELLSDLQPMLSLRPDHAGVWTSVGRVHLALGDVKEAQKALLRARKLDPKSELVQRVLREVKSQRRTPNGVGGDAGERLDP